MRQLPVVAALLFIPLAGCLEGPAAPSAVSPCEGEAPTVLSAVDELVLRPNKTYLLEFHEHDDRWGHLVLEPCTAMPVTVVPRFKGSRASPEDFAFLYVFPEGDAPLADDPFASDWGVPAGSGACGSNSFAGGWIRFANAIDGRGRLELVVAGSNLYGSIAILTGTDRTDRPTRWDLGQHPDLRVLKPAPSAVNTQEFQVPPRTQRLSWNQAQDPGVPSVLNVASWRVRQSGASVGQFWDSLTIKAGQKSEGYQMSGSDTCLPFSPGIAYRGAILNAEAEPVTVTRRFDESSVQTSPTNVGVALLNIPLAPVAGMAD
ncbi:MAG: hypothetical protein HYT80_01850 [Euryarchaeota archaeon]|nr:hypothetical protein [Euryarchaeota archaeon]